MFILVRRKSDFKTILDIAQEIRRCCSWYKCEGPVDIGKNTDEKLTGSITELKKETWFADSPDSSNSLEMSINRYIYSYLGDKKGDYGSPFEAVEKYIRACQAPEAWCAASW